jgi:hypothetical protein
MKKLLLLVLCLTMPMALYAATVSKGKTFASDEEVTNTKLHQLVDQATVTGVVSSDITDGTITADDIALGAVETTEILDNTITATDLSATLTFSALDFVDLASIIHNTTALQGLRLPQIGAAPSSPVSGEGFVGWDQTNNTLETYDGSSWVPVGNPGTPALTLSTTNAAGAATTVVRTDATIAVFDATVPVTQAYGDAAATGSAGVAARRDHRHAMPAFFFFQYATTAVNWGTGASQFATLATASAGKRWHPLWFYVRFEGTGAAVGTEDVILRLTLDDSSTLSLTLLTDFGTAVSTTEVEISMTTTLATRISGTGGTLASRGDLETFFSGLDGRSVTQVEVGYDSGNASTNYNLQEADFYAIEH